MQLDKKKVLAFLTGERKRCHAIVAFCDACGQASAVHKIIEIGCHDDADRVWICLGCVNLAKKMLEDVEYGEPDDE